MTDCTRCLTVIEDGDLRCAICALPVPFGRELADKPRAQVLRCTECNAAVAFSAEHQAPRCGFCCATMAIEHPVDPIEAAQVRIPFTVDRDAAERSLRGWLSRRGYFAPRALHDEAVLESLVPLCWAGWIVNARAGVTWTADSDAGARRSAWAPHAGQVQLTFDSICVPASRGLRRDECQLLSPYYDLSTAVPIETPSPGEPPTMAGMPVMIESFEAQRSAARAHVQRAIEAVARTRVERYIPGRRFRKVHVACLLEGQTTDRVALPAWVLAYRYRDRPYRAIVHGQRPEIVLGSSPLDWRKIVTLAGSILLGLAAIALVILLLSGCGGSAATPDAQDFFERCEPSGPFAPLTGRAAVQATLNVHVDAGGLIKVDTSSKLLLLMDLVQDGTSLAVSATPCRVQVPDIPLAGQELPIQFQVPDATVASVGSVTGTAQLSSADESCATLDSQPITLVLGARLDPADLATAPLPESDPDAVFAACSPSATTPCATATGTGCACDQESDGKPGISLIARNVPAVDLDQIFVTLRTVFALHGKVHTTDLVKGRIDASLDTGILECQLLDGSPCTVMNLRLVQALHPVITPQLDNPSTFRAVRVPDTLTCADVIATEGMLFPR